MKSRFILSALAVLGLALCSLPLKSQVIPGVSTTGNLGALNNVVTLQLSGQSTCGADVSGTWSGTITFQLVGQSNNPVSATAVTPGGTTGSTTTGNGIFAWASGGVLSCQVKMTSYTSGTATVTLQAVPGSSVQFNAGGGTVTANVTVVNTPGVTIQNTPAVAIAAPTNGAGQVIVTTPAPVGTIGVVQQAAPLATTPVQPPTPFGVTPCPAASISASVCASAAPYATAVSPAPGNLLGHGYNSAGVTAPIICHNYATVQIAATTQSTETVVVPSAAGKVIYVCSVSMSALGTVTGYYGLGTSATNVCGSVSNLFVSNPGAAAGPPVPVSVGNGVGVIAQTAAGVALCFFNATTSAGGAAQVNIMYEQFLRSLTPEQLDEFCSIPKRCALYGLVKHLDRLLNRVENPIP